MSRLEIVCDRAAAAAARQMKTCWVRVHREIPQGDECTVGDFGVDHKSVRHSECDIRLLDSLGISLILC